MSFDLRFVARPGRHVATRDEIRAYFAQHVAFAKVTEEQIVYENDITGADFIIDFEDDPTAPMTLYLNLIRPSFWALEAADILEPMADACGLDAHDLQTDVVGSFGRDAFLASWETSNVWACKTQEAPEFTMARADLDRHWRWNRFVEKHDRYVDDAFLPKICYYRREGKLRSYVTAPVGERTTLPLVDDVILGTSVLRRRFLRTPEKTFVMTTVPFSELATSARAVDDLVDDIRCVGYEENAEPIVSLAQRFHVVPEKNSGVWVGNILEREVFSNPR